MRQGLMFPPSLGFMFPRCNTVVSPQSEEGSRNQHIVPLAFTTICSNIVIETAVSQ